jgi:hypothetical protein
MQWHALGNIRTGFLTLSHYRRAMKTAGKFLLVLMGATTLRLQLPDCAALPQPQQRSNRGAINHFGRENLQELRPGIKKNTAGVVLDDSACPSTLSQISPFFLSFSLFLPLFLTF